MKPLVRWTFSYTNHQAFLCLKESIKQWINLYQDQFDYVICHNQSSTNTIKQLETLSKKYNITIFDQSITINSLPIKPSGTSWKLYPPRLRLDSYEIFIDNDLIVYNKIPTIERAINLNKTFITEAVKRCYGIYDDLCPSHSRTNSGLFGVPPHLDLGAQIKVRLKSNKWSEYFDEQGIVSSVILQHNNEIIPLSDISICLDDYRKGKYGIHFVGLNKGIFTFWDRYIQEEHKLKIF